MPARTSERGIIGVCSPDLGTDPDFDPRSEAGVWARQQIESSRSRIQRHATTKCFMKTTHFPCAAHDKSSAKNYPKDGFGASILASATPFWGSIKRRNCMFLSGISAHSENFSKYLRCSPVPSRGWCALSLLLAALFLLPSSLLLGQTLLVEQLAGRLSTTATAAAFTRGSARSRRPSG